MSRTARAAPTLAAFAAAFALRLSALDFGLPGAAQPFSFHPDEYNTVRVLAAVRPDELDLNPRYFHNPPLYYYLVGAAWAAGQATGWLPALDRMSPHDRPADVARLYRLGRLLSAVAGAATAALAAAAVTQAAGPGPGLAAGLLVALAPAHVACSQYMDVDALLGLFCAAVLLVLTRMRERPGMGRAVAAGALAGLGTATKYNGVLLVATAAIVALLTPPPRIARAAAVLGAATAAFLAANPYALLDAPAFVGGVRFVLFERAASRWSGLEHGAGFPLRQLWPWAFGEPGLLLALAGAVLGFARRSAGTLAPAILVVGVHLSLWASGTDYVRYALPAVPALAMLAARVPWALSPPWPRRMAAAALAAALFAQAHRLSALLPLAREPDPRQLASAWLDRTIAAGSRILVPREPYYGSPPRLFTDWHYPRGRGRRPPRRFEVISAGWDPRRLDDPQLAAAVLSETEWLYPATDRTDTGRFLSALLDGERFAEVARFDRPARAWSGLLLEAPLPPPGTTYRAADAARLADRRLPHDLKYLNPAILILVPVRRLSDPDRPPPAAPPGRESGP